MYASVFETFCKLNYIFFVCICKAFKQTVISTRNRIQALTVYITIYICPPHVCMNVYENIIKTIDIILRNFKIRKL